MSRPPVPSIQCERIRRNLCAIFESDRRSTFSAYEETARFCAGAMLDAGLVDVELEPVPADGKTAFGDWVMPLAWDANDATLRLLGNGGAELLADYKTLADSLIQQSAPTPPEGVECELVWYEKSRPEDWKGKIVFTREHAQKIKGRLAAAGALGVVSYYHPFPSEDPSSTYWYNTWSDRPGGWWATASDSKLFGFSLSPRAGAALEGRLARGDAFRSGTLPFISGRIPGKTPEEIIVTAHLYEHGAHDNASGATCLIETAAQLNAAIREGRLQQPQRSIRFLLMAECFGVLAYATLRRERAERTVAGINLDGVGGRLPIRVVGEPSCCDAGQAAQFMKLAAEEWGPQSVEPAPFELCDNLLADPMIGIPMIWPHVRCRRQSWHTSIDSLDVVDYNFIEEMAGVAGAFLMQIAGADLPTPPVRRRSASLNRPEVLRQPGPGGRIPVRRTIGPLSLDRVPLAEWPEQLVTHSPRWWNWHTQALWLADGNRSLDEIAVLVQMKREDIIAYFEFLAHWKYVELS
jgi:hypothetical protein